MFNLQVVQNLGINEQTEILLILTNIERLKKKIKQENELIEICLNELKKENIGYFNQLNNLEIDINILRSKNNINIKVNTDINKSEVDDEIKLEFKKLFRKISQKCHPDKTDDMNLHSVFHKAKMAYDKYDFDELVIIYNKIYEQKIENKKDILLNQLKDLEEEYRSFSMRKAYNIMKLFNSKSNVENIVARKLYIETLFEKIIELENLKLILTKQPGI